MNYNLHEKIDEILKVREEYIDLEPISVLKNYKPNPPASEQELIKAENKLGFKINSQYKEFLKIMNGFDNFQYVTDLFGTTDFNGSEKYKAAIESLNLTKRIFEEEEIPLEINIEDALLIGADENGNLVVIMKVGSNLEDKVFCIGNGGIDNEYDDFYQYLNDQVEFFKEWCEIVKAEG
ncbi:MAG: SMI1/KNR4 family protein [Clostridiaceae bacterium]